MLLGREGEEVWDVLCTRGYIIVHERLGEKLQATNTMITLQFQLGDENFCSETQKRSHYEFQPSGSNYLWISKERTTVQMLFAPSGTLEADV